MSPALLSRMRTAHRSRPCDFVDDLPGQSEFLTATERRVIWYGANGLGKTRALVRRLIRVMEGADPICAGVRRPLSILVVVTSYDAASARDLADQLYSLMPEGLVAQVELGDDGTPTSRCSSWYGRGKGFRGRPPRIVVQRGPLRGTALNVATLGAGTLAAAGVTADLIVVNEPISRELFTELATRDRAQALGYLWYALTPIPGAPGQTWIPEVVREVQEAGGQIRYIQTRLSPEALILPSGRALESWAGKTAPRIAAWDPIERPMRMGESLEPILESGYFTSIWRDSIVFDTLPPSLNLWLVGSLDHSLQQGRLRIGVTGYQVAGPANARRLIGYDLVDVKAGPDYDEAARLFLDAIEEAGIPLDAIDQWTGDRSVSDKRQLVRRDNYVWRGAVLRELRQPRRLPPNTAPTSIKAPRSLWDIATPHKYGGSSMYLMGRLRAAMAAEPPELRIHRRCVHLLEDIQRWDSTRASPHKDGLDRVGYGYEAAHRHYGLWRG